MKKLTSKSIDYFLYVQKRYAIWIFLLGILLSIGAAPRAIKLLTSIKTDLIHLLPENIPSVRYTDEVKKKFDRRSRLFVIINSPDPEANKNAMLDLTEFLKQLPSIDSITIERRGMEFFDQNKLLLIDIRDLYTIHDRLKEKIQKKKLGSMYIDFEEGGDDPDNVSFDDLIKRYEENYTVETRNKYQTNKDETVFLMDILPKSRDPSLSFFKSFVDEIEKYTSRFNFKKYNPEMTYGYAGAIKTRVDQYQALINDLKKAGMISGISIFLLLFLYFGRFIDRREGFYHFVVSLFQQVGLVVAIFIPMIISTMFAFWFCSFFFKQLNLVTSFLFAIIFGLGVDIGIHLISRYIQDRCRGESIDKIHRDVVTKTGKSCSIGILTTVASFYILTLTDFKGFSEFGWIAGNGLVIALICYIVFFPCLLLMIDKYHLIRIKRKIFEVEKTQKGKRRWIPYPKYLLGLCAVLTILSLVDLPKLHFEWDFGKLKMKLAHQERQKRLAEETYGRVNAPAIYLVENEVQARKIRQIVRKRKESDKDFHTIDFIRSYYDMVPFDQEEKLALLKKIDILLSDDALNTVNDDEKKLIKEFRNTIAGTKLIKKEDIPNSLNEFFWGNTGLTDKSASFVMPLPHLQLDNGNNAKAFYQDVHIVDALGLRFYAVSDAIIFAEVLQTLFRDSKKAIFLTSLVILALVTLHFRNWKETLFIFTGLVCGIIWMLGIMAIFDFRLNFYNMIIIPAMIGMGVDNSVHVVHRFKEIKYRSIIEVLKTSGGAALMASLTTILGYSGMCYTRHPGLQSIGFMAVIGMGTCLVGSLFLLPLLLQVFLKPGKK